jgi:hypothetical protein
VPDVDVEVKTPSTEVCQIYQHGDFSGWCAQFPEGDYTLGDAQKRGFKNDDMSSIVVAEGYEVELFQHGDFGGMNIKVPLFVFVNFL